MFGWTRNKEEIIINTLIDGKLLAQMMISGAHNLYNYRQEVNDLNVFPVPDGDTGTNMSMTVTAMAKTLEENVSSSASKAADTMSFATLRGARGNSGVILSQFFRGISKELKGKSKVTSKEFAEALRTGSDAAYKAVMNPTEGTILTVAREIAQAAVKEAEECEDCTQVLKKALERGNKVLSKTPEMLPALKSAGVVDAGGQGWVYFLEGALYYLENEKGIEAKELEAQASEAPKGAQGSVDTSNIKYMYCTEFIIEKGRKEADVQSFRRAIEVKGDSMLVIDDEDIVKVHIHTNNPGFVLERAVKIGDMIDIKIDNMKYQHRSLINAEEEKKPEKVYPKKDVAFVAVCAGDGLCDILKDIGIDYIIEGGQTMNPSTEDVLEAVEKVNADTVFVFPNNKNIILAAEQASSLAENNVIVLKSKNIPQCISAMLAYNDKKSSEDNEKKMSSVMKDVSVGQITYAVRDTEMDGIEIKEGNVIGIAGGKIELTDTDADTVCKGLLGKIADEDTEFINIYYGEGVTKEQAEELGEVLEEEYPDAEVSLKYGGQPLYYYIISAE